MEKLAQKTTEEISTTQDLFAKWQKEMESLCVFAVFRQQLDVMAVLQQNLVQNQEAIATMLQPLTQHLNHNSVSQSGKVVGSQSSGGRVAASLPGMKSKPNVVAAPLSFSAAAKIGSPMAVSTIPAVTANGRKDKHVFMEPYRTNLPTDWRGLSRPPVSEPNTAKSPSTLSDEEDSSMDENESCDSERNGVEQPNKVFLLNLSRESTSKSIAKYFEKHGSVVDVKIFRFPSGDSRGQGWVEFTVPEEADDVLRNSPHRVDGRKVEAKPFIQREPRSGTTKSKSRSYQIFLGGLPSHLSNEEIKSALDRYVKVRDLRLISERGYAYVDLENEEDVEKLLKTRYVKIGQKIVECKENRRP